MPVRHLLVAGAVPVPTELDQDARRRPFVHQLLRWDSIVSTVFGHVQATAGVSRGKDAGLTIKEEEDEPSMPRRIKKLSEPAGLPDLLQIITPENPTSSAASPGPASPDLAHLSSSLQLRLGHIQHVKRLTRREGRVTRPDPPLSAPGPRLTSERASVPSRRVSAPAQPSAFAARLRKISVTDTLRQVGQDLRRIADHFQLSRLMGGQPVGGAGQEVGWMYPVVTMGCVIICGITAVLGRALRR